MMSGEIGKAPDGLLWFAIQRAVASGFGLSPHPFLQIGQRVRINGGSLCGLEGIIADVRKRDRLILSVTMLQRSIAVEIDSAWATPIHTSRAEPSCTKALYSPA